MRGLTREEEQQLQPGVDAGSSSSSSGRALPSGSGSILLAAGEEELAAVADTAGRGPAEVMPGVPVGAGSVDGAISYCQSLGHQECWLALLEMLLR